MSLKSLLPANPRLRQGILVGLICGLLLILLRATTLLQPLDRAVMDTMFQLRGAGWSSPHVLIVKIDERDIEGMGGWPLPRKRYSDLILRLNKAGVKTIVFDVMFLQDSPSRADDESLIQTCAEAGNIVHAATFYVPPRISSLFFVPTRLETLYPFGQVPRYRLFPTQFGLPESNINCLEAIRGSASLPALLDSAGGLGHVTVYPEWDGALRRIPQIIRYRQAIREGEQVGLYPSLALSSALHFWNVPRDKVQIVPRGWDGGSEIRFPAPDGKVRRIPINSDGESMVNWVGDNKAIASFSYKDLMAKGSAVTDDMLSGRVVIIGITAPGAYEGHATPFSPNQPAVELQANALDNILEDRVIREAPHWMHIALMLLMSVVAGALVGGQSARINIGLLAVMCFGIYTLGGMLLAWGHVYLPIGSPLLCVLVSCIAALSYRQTTDAAQLRLAEERYALAVRGANDGLWDWNLLTNKIYYSPRWKEMMGCNDEEVTNSPDEWLRRVHPEDIGPLRDVLKEHVAGKTEQLVMEYRMLHKSGAYRWMLTRGLRVVNSENRAARMAGSHTDITERKRAERQLRVNAFYDALTGLPNRALFVNRLEQAVGRAHRRADYKFAVLFLDVDRFKNVNDSLGHTAGDELIKEMAKRIAVCLRLGDTPARLGGDEFTILLDDIEDVSDATRVAERFQQELSQPIMLGDQEVTPSISVGIALSTTGYEKAEDVLRDADIAVARAKSLGAGRREIFDTRMHERAVSLLRIESELRRALEKQAFEVYYQAMVDLKTGYLCGFEALARWPHPARGMIQPGEFIPIAEDTGLIIPMDQWVLRESCRQLNEWKERAGRDLELFMSVNLSSKQFSQADLVEQIQKSLQLENFDPHRLKLEITESAIMDNTESAAAMLLRLRELGLQLAIDDFGTGYSSLSYLHRFPMHTLKIDRSFVKAMSDRGEVEIVRAIITLSKNFGMTVVAEGVETEDQLRLLRELNCDIGQGYFFSRPLTGEDAFRLIESKPQW